jgi:hypothetical protein
MARHKFTPSEQLKAVERALSNPRTPKQLVGSLRLRARKLRKQIATERGQRPGLLGLIGFGRGRK